MKFIPARCPECDATPTGTVEEVKGQALLMSNGSGGYEYTSETEMWWDSQKSVTDNQDHVLLVCGESHDWWAAKEVS